MLNNSSELKDLESEIIKNRKVLDTVYRDTENLKRDRTSMEGEILTISKHLKYLGDEQSSKQKEYDDKQVAINGLNQQIIDKSKKRDDLESDMNKTETLLSDKKQEIIDIEQKIKEHQESINIKQEEINNRHKEAENKNSQVDEKIRKIEALLSELR